MGKKIKIGVLGLASIARRSTIPSLRELSDIFELKGIARRSKTPPDLPHDLGNISFFESYDELISTAGLDAVYIPLPNTMHFVWAKKALLRGLHVLVEKPLAVSFEQVNELTKIANENNLALMETFQFRFHPQFKKINTLLSQNRLGEIRSLTAYFCFPPFPDGDNIRYQKKLGGGALLDAGGYTIKISQLLVNKPLNVCSATLHYDKCRDVDIWGSAHLTDEEKKVSCHLIFGFDHSYRCSVDITGSKGSLRSDRIFTCPPDMKPKIFRTLPDGSTQHYSISHSNQFTLMLRYFYSVCFDNHLKKIEYQNNMSLAWTLDEVRNSANLNLT